MVEQKAFSFRIVCGHSLLVRSHTFNCWNALQVYEQLYGGAEQRFHLCKVGGHSLSVRYHTFSCWNALEIYEKPNGGAETRFHVVWSVDILFR